MMLMISHYDVKVKALVVVAGARYVTPLIMLMVG